MTYLNSKANAKNVAGMARFGINAKNTLGISIPILREAAREHKKNHELALELGELKYTRRGSFRGSLTIRNK